MEEIITGLAESVVFVVSVINPRCESSTRLVEGLLQHKYCVWCFCGWVCVVRLYIRHQMKEKHRVMTLVTSPTSVTRYK